MSRPRHAVGPERLLIVARHGHGFDGGQNPCGDSACGTVFELSNIGFWLHTKLHGFGAYGTDGVNPYAGVLLDSSGNLYGATGYGGSYGGAAVLEIMP
ncbi:MAG: hypothetical protein WA655_12500 [Candidatus Korobacteraceae bacterium]